MDDEKIDRTGEDSANFERRENKTEMRIDNNPDKIDLSETTEKIKKNPWMLVSGVLGVVVVLLLLNTLGILNLSGGVTGNVIAGEDAGQKIVAYLNTRTGGGVEYLSFKDNGGLYEVTVAYNGDEIPVFVTKDGEYFVQGAIPINEASAQPAAQQQKPQEVVKSDKPVAEAFVFSYCPYGLQFQKALMPVYDLLKDKTDIELVAIGAMHGEYEKQESLRQICIEKEYGKDKIWQYLEKFMGDNDIGGCSSNMDCSKPLVEKLMNQIGINTAKINTCMQKDAEKIYQDQNSRASELGVSGSPTFVINGVKVQVGRDANSIKESICNAFTEPPEECNKVLSSAGESPGFGYSASSSTSGVGSC